MQLLINLIYGQYSIMYLFFNADGFEYQSKTVTDYSSRKM